LTGQIALLRTPDAGCSRGNYASRETRKERIEAKGLPLNLNSQLQGIAMGLLPTPRAEKQSPQSREDFTPNLAARLAMLPTPMSGFSEASHGRANGNFEQKTLAIANSLLPTPKSQNANSPAIHGNGGQDLQTAIQMLPTPTQRDYKSGKGKCQEERERTAGPSLSEQIEAPGKNIGFKLWPEFVEHMMGYLEGFTELPD